MPRSTKRSRRVIDEADDDVASDDDLVVVKEDEELGRPDIVASQKESTTAAGLFSSQAPEASQALAGEKPSDRRNLESMDPVARDRAVTSLARLVLFKGLARDPMDRLKLLEEANLKGSRIGSAALSEVANRVENVFGFQLCRLPEYMEEQKHLAKKFKNRLYLLNGLADDDQGHHSKAIHTVHEDSAAFDRGFLMVVLALAYCQGDPRADGSRWIDQRDLYRLLNALDDSLPEEPPNRARSQAVLATQLSQAPRSSDAVLTPPVDALLERFVHQEYLLKEKEAEADGDVWIYAMGPRAALEIGRKQIIHFCAEILDEEPDVTMLQEVENEQEQGELQLENMEWLATQQDA